MTFVVVLGLKEGQVFDDYASLLLAMFLITVPIRVFVWIVMLRCAKNTDSGVFRALAVTLVIVDILHKLFFWSAVGLSLLDGQKADERSSVRFDQCKAAIIKQFDQPLDNLHGSPQPDYGSGEGAYKVLTKSRTKTYLCVIDSSGIRVSEEDYVKWWGHRRNVDIAGTSLVTEVELSTRFLARQYGAPGDGDSLRVSGYYAFVSDAGEVFTIYDYKSTTVWDSDSDLPTPEMFWSSDKPVELSVGAAPGSDYEPFVNWIEDKHARWLGLNRTK